MYERFFGLRERPFDLTPNPRFLVMTEAHREALSNLEYAIAGRKGITLLLGDAGCGKTTVIRTAIERQPARVHCVHIINPALTRDEFVETLAVQFELTDAARHSKAALLTELQHLLQARREADETTVLVIDEAQSLSDDLLEEIRLLANIETAEDKLLSLILAGQPELAFQLNKDSLRQFKQRVALRCELRPLTSQETLAYLSGRIRAAGGVASRIFTREAATLLHEHSGGIPRLVNVLADNALLTAFGRQTVQVTSQMVTEVARDFHMAPPAAAPVIQAMAVVDDFTGAEGSSPEPAAIGSMLHAPAAAAQPDAAPSAPADPISTPAEPRMFGAVTARRRFPFLGRRGTA